MKQNARINQVILNLLNISETGFISIPIILDTS